MYNHSYNEQINASAAQNSLALVLVDQHGYDLTKKSELGTISQGEAVGDASKRLQDALKKETFNTQENEDNIKYLKTHENSLNARKS